MPYDSGDNAWSELCSGNPDALHLLYNDHYLGMLNYAMKLSGDHDLSRDCITQVLLNLHRHHKSLPEVTNVRSYLLTCVRNEINAAIRIGKRTRFYDPQTIAEMNSTLSYEDYIIGQQTEKEQRDQLKAAFAQLSAREKELLRLRFFEDQSYDSIASDCGITKRTAYNIVNMAIRRLKDFLTRQSRNRIIYEWMLYTLTVTSF
jgi:RNA polymerase sigma-70 factor (ECF subfamily)